MSGRFCPDSWASQGRASASSDHRGVETGPRRCSSGTGLSFRLPRYETVRVRAQRLVRRERGLREIAGRVDEHRPRPGHALQDERVIGQPDPQALHQPHRQHHRRRGREEPAALDEDGLARLDLDGLNRPRVIAGKADRAAAGRGCHQAGRSGSGGRRSR